MKNLRTELRSLVQSIRAVPELDVEKAVDELESLVKEERKKMLKDIEELHYGVAGSIAWSDKHTKEELLEAIYNHVDKLWKKYGGKIVPLVVEKDLELTKNNDK